MRVLGLDLSVVRTGYSVIDGTKVCACGTIETKKLKTTNIPKRLKYIVAELLKIINEFSPTVVVIEDVYHGVNVKTVAILNRLNGAVVVSIPDNIEVIVINASRARKTVLGQGHKYSKIDVFNWAVSKYSLKDYELKEHNDITDSMLLAHYAIMVVASK